jgi:type IV secretion system protein VirB9
LVFSSIGAFAQDSARTVQYHSQDIVPIRAKVKYTTLIELPTTEKIMEAATGDKEFWIVDVVGNFCFVHPAKQGISSNLNLITDKGNIYSFTLQDISGSPEEPDLKVIVEPADRSAIVTASGPAQFVPAAQLEQSKQEVAALQSHVEQAVDEYKSAYPAYAKACLDEDTSGAARLLTGERLTADLTADLEAKRKEREVRCKPEAERLAEFQREILAAQQ